MRDYYQQQLKELNNDLIEMGSLLEGAIKSALLTLESSDKSAIAKTKDYEKEIDQMEKELESRCLKLILHQQPVARDFHLISAALKMITDMERIGDQADDIAMLSLHIGELRKSNAIDDIKKMGAEVLKMIHASIKSFIDKDMDLAMEVCRCDDVVDSLFNQVKEEIVNILRINDDMAEDAPDVLMIAKYFERIGDHTVNIAEWVIFAFTGHHDIKGYDSDKRRDLL